MLLGKRPRPPMDPKTSSMEFPDGGVLFDVEAPQPLDQDELIAGQALDPRWVLAEIAQISAAGGGADWCSARFVGPMVSPRGVERRNPGELSGGDRLGTASFLRACALCHRRLGPGRDAFMYRGEIAFCSLECRQQHMNMDMPSAAQEP